MQQKCLLCLNHFSISEKFIDSCHVFSSFRRFGLIAAFDDLEVVAVRRAYLAHML